MSVQSNLGLYPAGKFYPFKCFITAIVNGMTTLVTTSVDHMFVIGNQIMFFIPKGWGITQLNHLSGYVIDIPSQNQVTVNINTLTFDAFTTPTPTSFVVIDYPEIAPVGDSNTGTLSPGGVPILPITVPGAQTVTNFPDFETI